MVVNLTDEELSFTSYQDFVYEFFYKITSSLFFKTLKVILE